ncbi:MAG: V-type ATP synthase subunit E [Candidatus Brocadiales bacterium]
MSLERIKTQVLEDAHKEAERLIGAAQSGLTLKLSREKLLLKEGLEKRLDALQKELQKEKERTLSILRARYDRQILESKNKVIDRLFKEAMDSVLSLTKQEYSTLLEEWLDRLSIDEKVELRLSSRDLRSIGPELVRRANESSKENLFFLAPSAANIKGGFILKANDFEIDRSLECILNHLREELISEVAEKLFGK